MDRYDNVVAGKPITWNIIKTERFGEIWVSDDLLIKMGLIKEQYGIRKHRTNSSNH
jgi:hypothetical protein